MAGTMRIPKKITKRYERKVEATPETRTPSYVEDRRAALNNLFFFDPENPPAPKRKHAKHNIRWKRRKIAAASRARNRRNR